MTTVLIVDSDVIWRSALKKFIESKEGFLVEALFSDGEDAVKYCRQNTPDLIFMDFKLPGINGIKAAGQIEALQTGAQIYLLTAYPDVDFYKEAFQTGIRNFFRKPVHLDEIESALFQKEKASDDDYSDIIKKIESITQANDFRMVYTQSKVIAADIMEASGRKNDTTARIMHTVLVRLLSRYSEDPSDLKEVVERFHINVNFLDNEIMVEMWLCNFLDYIYKRRFVERYNSVKPVFEYIDEHIREYINMVMIEDHCHLSQQYLLRLFKDQMKMSALDYIQSRKMLLAKWYLYFEEYSTLDVASKLGYGDVGYFSKVFKKYEGLTPHQYKLSVRSGAVKRNPETAKR